jgi:hypothetical protein
MVHHQANGIIVSNWHANLKVALAFDACELYPNTTKVQSKLFVLRDEYLTFFSDPHFWGQILTFFFRSKFGAIIFTTKDIEKQSSLSTSAVWNFE